MARIVTEETRRKISQTLKGRPKPGKRGIHHSPSTEFKKGNTLSQETRNKMSQSRMGRKLSDETKLKIGLAHKGKKLSLEHRILLSEVKKGKKLSVEHKEKISRSLLKKWDDIGRKKYKRPLHQGSKYLRWRKEVWERDNYTCQKCFARCGNGKRVYIEAHHSLSWNEHPDVRFVVSNGVTLCRKCHKEIHR